MIPSTTAQDAVVVAVAAVVTRGYKPPPIAAASILVVQNRGIAAAADAVAHRSIANPHSPLSPALNRPSANIDTTHLLRLSTTSFLSTTFLLYTYTAVNSDL